MSMPPMAKMVEFPCFDLQEEPAEENSETCNRRESLCGCVGMA